MKAITLKIHGRVQGVYFRKHTKDKALKLGVNGTVRNSRDGCVEVNAEANEQVLDEFIEWCHNGPSRASVSKVDIHESTLKNYSDFVILRD